MIDSHCHLDHEPLFSDLLNVIQRSKDVGIEKLLTISTSFESFSAIFLSLINANCNLILVKGVLRSWLIPDNISDL